MTRRTTARLGMVLLFMLVIADIIAAPPNPHKQPSIIALGSGAASSGGFCGALPE